MYAFFTKLLNMSLTASVLVIAVIVLRLLLRKAPRKFTCILWVLVAIRLICPISVSSALSVFNLFHAGTDGTGQINYFQYNDETEMPELLFDVPALVNDDASPDSMTVGTHTSDLYIPTIMCIWMIGVIMMLSYAVTSYVRLKRKVSIAIRRKDHIYICDEITSPFILGIIRPHIYLPSGLTEQTEGYVLAHERAHLRRRDHWWKPFGFLLLSVYWFHPVYWVAYILFCKDIEAACDETVISDMSREGIAGYSEALLACAAQRRILTVCPVAFGETDVKNRVKNALTYKKPAFWIVCVAVAACAVGMVCFLTNPVIPENANADITDAGSTQTVGNPNAEEQSEQPSSEKKPKP